MSLQYETRDDEQHVDDTQEYEVRPPLPVYTILLIAAIGAVFVAQLVAGLDIAIAAAAFDKLSFRISHEYWRILTGATLHGGPLHVFMNCYAFYSFGRIFEMLSNRAHLAIVFLLAAVGGGVLSLIFAPDGISVGASGGILGIVSYLAVYAFKRRRFVSPEFRKSLLTNIGFILVFGLILYQQIDNFGHIGGLIVGAVYGLLQIPTDDHTDPRLASRSVEMAGIGALALYIATCIFSILLILRYV